MHAASDIQAGAVAESMGRYNQMSSAPITVRTRSQVARFFDGLDLAGPGVVSLDEWWPPAEVALQDGELVAQDQDLCGLPGLLAPG